MKSAGVWSEARGSGLCAGPRRHRQQKGVSAGASPPHPSISVQHSLHEQLATTGADQAEQPDALHACTHT